MAEMSNEMKIKAKKTRRTINEKICKKKWTYNGRMVVGCIMQIDPDGQQEKEWCEIDEALSGKSEKTWAYCTDDLDMDSVRMAVSDFYENDMKLMKSFCKLVKFPPTLENSNL